MSRQSPIDLSKGQWQYLRKELIERTIQPWGSVTFVLYFFMAIVMFGALGVWIEVYQFLTSSKPDAARIIVAMITFFSALIGTSAAQLAYDAFDEPNKIMLAFALIVLVFFSGFAVLLSRLGSTNAVFVLNFICSICAVWVWWIANAKTKTFAYGPDTATGGDPTRELDGNFEGFKA